MIYFSCDYHYGAHEKVMEYMMKYNSEPNTGYGMDPHCEHAKTLIRKACRMEDANVHFLVGGTQTNTTIIAAALRPYQGVIAAQTGHINAHETGAIESSGHKVIALPCEDGKLTAEQIHAYYVEHWANGSHEHIVMPKMVYISQSTEIGSIYSRAELESISRVCREDGLYLFMDGARLGYALTSPANDLDLPTIAKCCDVFYIGGTKCGALMGEAVVITNQELNENFRYMIKQRGGMLAKGWLLGIQFEALMENNLYFDICRHANEQAMRIKKVLADKGMTFQTDSPTNQQFVYLKPQIIEKLKEQFVFCDDEPADGDRERPVRFCTSWATTDVEVDALVDALEKLL